MMIATKVDVLQWMMIATKVDVLRWMMNVCVKGGWGGGGWVINLRCCLQTKMMFFGG